jgi:nitrite reductase/ring-hydroxylating ferredoxin subunit
MDTTRGDRCSVNGYPRPTTPNLASFAEDAVTYRNAWVPGGWTGPTHASLFTGLRPEQVDPERPRVVETPWGPMALYRLGEEVLCTQAFCPHLDGPLFQGTLHEESITCPWHLWRFDLRSGARIDAGCPADGPDAQPLERCEVRLSAGGTLVLRPASGSGPRAEDPARQT